MKYFTKIYIPLTKRLNLTYGNIHVREILRYRKKCCQILTFSNLSLDTQYWIWKVYNILTVNLVLKLPPILFAVYKLYFCKELNYILIFCAMTQKYNIFQLKNIIRSLNLSTESWTSNFWGVLKVFCFLKSV